MLKPPTVSVMLASYKHPLWIGEAIESVLNQTFKDLELIIVDDGSNDGSAEIIKSYAKKDKRIKYEIFPKNRGAITAMKKCYDLCSSKYLALISSDDVWELEKLKKQVPILDKQKKLGAVFGVPTFIDANSKKIDIPNNEFMKSTKLKNREKFLNFFFNKGNCVCHPTILIRKECYEKVGFYNPTLRSLPDFEMWVRLFFHYDIKILNDVLIKFRKHRFNESGENLPNIIRGQTEYKQILNRFLEQIKTVKELIEIFPEYTQMFAVKKNILVPFYIARIALTRNMELFSDFAFDVLYSELAKPRIKDLIEKNDLYSMVELSKDVARANIYKIGKTGTSEKRKVFIKIPLIFTIEKIKSISNSKFQVRVLGIKVIERRKSSYKKYIKFFGIKIK